MSMDSGLISQFANISKCENSYPFHSKQLRLYAVLIMEEYDYHRQN